MRLFLISCTSLLLVFSCVTQKKANDISWEYNNYTNSQKELINTGKSDDPMRIFLITNKQDSILLRTKSNRINLNKDLETTKLLSQRLLSTVQDPAHAGVGIAAPQVGILKNMIVVQRYDKEGFPFETYINPTIKQYSKKTQFCLEGCLSIPDKMDTTKNRAYAILLEYEKLDGTHEIEMIEAFTAVIFQHEIDHLNGILFTDHLDIEIEEAEERLRKEKQK
ncbi:MAG: peptide deformylase [Flavobacteriales bacterium]|jgi:peptide deformylase|tara:strand:- start:7280 stop:7945 length:666 start_codon:yes stop_codon:yes gene_type:complete